MGRGCYDDESGKNERTLMLQTYASLVTINDEDEVRSTRQSELITYPSVPLLKRSQY